MMTKTDSKAFVGLLIVILAFSFLVQINYTDNEPKLPGKQSPTPINTYPRTNNSKNNGDDVLYPPKNDTRPKFPRSPRNPPYTPPPNETKIPKIPSPQLKAERILPLNYYSTIHNSRFPRVALVQPTFTDAAYNKFYTFFGNPKLDPIKYLKSKAGTSSYKANTLNSLLKGIPNSTGSIFLINDQQVHFGQIFDKDGQPIYSTMIFFHNEYITLDEYQNIMKFVKSGGNILVVDGNAFFAEVDYNPTTNEVILISGHGWQFNGHSAKRTDNYQGRFFNQRSTSEHLNWFGSFYDTFRRGPIYGAVLNNDSNPHPVTMEFLKKGIKKIGSAYYTSHEENSVITPNIHTIATWKTSFSQKYRGIKVYEKLPYGPYGGSIACLGIFSSDVMAKNDIFELVRLLILHQGRRLNDPWIRYPYNGGVMSNNVPVQFTAGLNYSVTLNGKFINISTSAELHLSDGTYKLEVHFYNSSKVILRAVTFRVESDKPALLLNGVDINKNPVVDTKKLLNVTMVDTSALYLRWKTSFRIGNPYKGYSYVNQNLSRPIEVLLNLSSYSGQFQISFIGADARSNFVQYSVLVNPASKLEDRIPPQFNPEILSNNDHNFSIGILTGGLKFAADLVVSSNYGRNWSVYPMIAKGDWMYSNVSWPTNVSKLWYLVFEKTNKESDFLNNIQTITRDSTVLVIQNVNLTASSVRIRGLISTTISSVNVSFVDRNFTLFKNITINIPNPIFRVGKGNLLDLPILVGNKSTFGILIIVSSTRFNHSMFFLVNFSIPKVVLYQNLSNNGHKLSEIYSYQVSSHLWTDPKQILVRLRLIQSFSLE